MKKLERLNGNKKENPQTLEIKGFTDSQELVEMRGIGVVTGYVSFAPSPYKNRMLRRSLTPPFLLSPKSFAFRGPRLCKGFSPRSIKNSPPKRTDLKQLLYVQWNRSLCSRWNPRLRLRWNRTLTHSVKLNPPTPAGISLPVGQFHIAKQYFIHP